MRARPRHMAAAAAGALLLLSPTVAGAQPDPGTDEPRSFIDPNDPCLLPGGPPPPAAPATDRAQIAEVHVTNVDCSYALGIAEGYPDGTYRPAEFTRRDQMASFIVRALEAAGYDLPEPSDQGFTDIGGNVHADAINQLAAIGVTQGATDTTYDPATLVPRDQMASFIVRAAEYGYGTEVEATGEFVDEFTDVPDGNVHKDNIQTGAEVLGLVLGESGGQYRPDESTRRDQMATFLVRLVDMTLVVE